MIDRQKDFDALIAKVFKSKDGKKVLEFLEERYIKTAVCSPGQVEGQGYYREGQNSIIRMFKTSIMRQERGSYNSGDNNE
jgi:hypothetical protein